MRSKWGFDRKLLAECQSHPLQVFNKLPPLCVALAASSQTSPETIPHACFVYKLQLTAANQREGSREISCSAECWTGDTCL